MQGPRCVKNVQIRSFCGLHFPAFELMRRDAWENTDKKSSEYGHLSRGDRLGIFLPKYYSKFRKIIFFLQISDKNP